MFNFLVGWVFGALTILFYYRFSTPKSSLGSFYDKDFVDSLVYKKLLKEALEFEYPVDCGILWHQWYVRVRELVG